jgi:hypothetical protein
MKRILSALLAIASLSLALAAAQEPPSQSQPSATPTSKTSSAKSSSGMSDSEIAAAKADHKVWVNLDTGIYHRGSRWYGKTKNGKFMTVDDAKKAGYKPAKRD